MSVEARCQGCLYWEPSSVEEIDGACRRFPPTRESSQGARPIFPTTYWKSWCGEWKDKTKHTLYEDELPNLERLST